MESIKDKIKRPVSLKRKNIEQDSKRKTSDEVWTELLETPESNVLLDLMGDEAEKEFNEGKAEKGGWGDRKQISENISHLAFILSF